MKHTVLLSLALCFASVLTQHAAAERFRTVVLSEEFFGEGAAVADINDDGSNDIISGPYWYAGPDFRTRHAYAPVKSYSISGYSDHFFLFAGDFNLDERVDILSIPIPGQSAVWYANPGDQTLPWSKHVVLEGVGNESPTMADMNADGVADLVCIYEGCYGYASPIKNQPTVPWQFTAISPNNNYGRFTHGLGVGDVNGDGSLDLLEKNGWWQQPATGQGPYVFHRFPFAEAGGSQMFARDIDGDGDQDIVSVQNAHAYGMAWFERRGQKTDAAAFVRHDILGQAPEDNPYGLAMSQMHAAQMADIDGDGIDDLITGKRFWAHGGKDPGAQELPALYWFRAVRSNSGDEFQPMLIDPRVGVGTQLTVQDVDGNGHLDIVVGNKLGTFLVLNSGDPSVRELSKMPSAVERHVPGTNEFKNGVRTTDPLTPDDELLTFVLPQGFKAQLVASEPQIAKPMNMAFDHRGRLWVSSSEEYPYAAPQDREPRDTIKILEDTTGDGRADKVTTFADKLNIPMGLYPYGDGVICYSVPNVLYLQDTDGDDVADKREILYGPFDATRDTHGMCNGFTRGFDGWLYACHGFNNQSTVVGKDGNSVTMHSGNTFRMRLDGSRIEHFTRGQVNPFGMAFDPTGDLFTADCHTKPVTLLMRGGVYQSFGKPHDGLGFVPDVMKHLNGSTAIGGLALYHAQQFPDVYHGSAFGGNVMTSRINRNSIHRTGSSVSAREEPDFLISGDPWFRPVDLQVGPDGALYVADFYNRIIGHYEVPLQHPGRDRHRGRIWKITYEPTGDRRDPGSGEHSNQQNNLKIPGPTHLEATVARLADSNLQQRMSAANQLVDEFGDSAVLPLRRVIRESITARERIHALWALHRLGQTRDSDLQSALFHSDPAVRRHGYLVLEATEPKVEGAADWILRGLQDDHPMVQRSAVMASTKHLGVSSIQPLLNLLERTPLDDVHLRHAARMSLRDHFENEEWFASITERLSSTQTSLVLEICLALESTYAGEFVAGNLDAIADADPMQLAGYLTHAARYASPDQLRPIADMAERQFESDIPFQEELLRSIRKGLSQRGVGHDVVTSEWASRLVRRHLRMKSDGGTPEIPPSLGWTYRAYPGTPDQGNPWSVSTRRNSADGQKATTLHSSFPAGESKTGIIRSDAFELPEIFEFYLAGHDGFPEKPIQQKNSVRVFDAATQSILKQWNPPRNDTAQPISWSTGDLAGRRVFVELADGDTARAYAWLAVGRFSVQALNPSTLDVDLHAATSLIDEFELQSFRGTISKMITRENLSRQHLEVLAKSLAALNRSGQSIAIADSVAFATIDSALRQQLIEMLVRQSMVDVSETLGKVTKVATAVQQRQIATALTSDRPGIESLLAMIERGDASRRLLASPTMQSKIENISLPTQMVRMQRLLKGMPDENAELVAVIADRKAGYLAHPGNTEAGAKLFSTHCQICHQVAGQGASVGPNLDGIGNRGLDRVLEDVLVPNRNIDAAFRASLVLTDDGTVISGLIKRTEGAQLMIVDEKGKEIAIRTDTIQQQKELANSPMPSNVHESLSAAQLNDLLAYLLSLSH